MALDKGARTFDTRQQPLSKPNRRVIAGNCASEPGRAERLSEPPFNWPRTLPARMSTNYRIRPVDVQRVHLAMGLLCILGAVDLDWKYLISRRKSVSLPGDGHAMPNRVPARCRSRILQIITPRLGSHSFHYLRKLQNCQNGSNCRYACCSHPSGVLAVVRL
ncbi:hypothetical protein J6590_004977 [Homalodisca vitripennis]|nr:hypothetical protein J6590_004977 [Homalodisca vitripennis]